MRKKEQRKYAQSLIDVLVDVMPELRARMEENTVDAVAAASLFGIWKQQNKSIGKRTFAKPKTITASEVEGMVSEGLVRCIGDKLEITSRGSEVIKTLILGDERSSFEDDGTDPTVREASAKINARANKKKKASEDWWDRFKGR